MAYALRDLQELISVYLLKSWSQSEVNTIAAINTVQAFKLGSSYQLILPEEMSFVRWLTEGDYTCRSPTRGSQ